MKRSKFSESQIAYLLKQAETGTAVSEVCRQAGISEATFCGAGVGAAIAGMRPVVEVQIFDFVTQMMDMIVNAVRRLPRDFTIEDDEVTPTLKRRRRVVMEHHLIDFALSIDLDLCPAVLRVAEGEANVLEAGGEAATMDDGRLTMVHGHWSIVRAPTEFLCPRLDALHPR